jgi:hypothetical protein
MVLTSEGDQVLTNMVAPSEAGLMLGPRQQQLDLLAQILTTPDKRALEIERERADEAPTGRPGVRRTVGGSGALSGASGLYMEVSAARRPGGASAPAAPAPSIFAPRARMHPLLKKLMR